MKILVSAGEASGDRYSAELVEALRARLPDAEFFGCAGKRLRACGVRPIVESEEIAVVGIFEVIAHIPRVFGALNRLARAARRERPAMAILTDSPDFHLRLARKLKREGVPVFYIRSPAGMGLAQGQAAGVAPSSRSSPLHLPIRGKRTFRGTGSRRPSLVIP